jgi:antitoxin CptB
MTGTRLSSADLDPRQRRILFRAWHRGMREMDLILGHFADAFLPRMKPTELDNFEQLLEQADRDLLHWILDAEDIPVEVDNALLNAIRSHHHHNVPLKGE